MDSLKSNVAFEAELIRGGGGVFKVWVDGQLIWDKRAQGRFPEDDEILAEVRQREK